MYEFIYLDIVYGRTDNGMLSFRNKTGEAEFKISFFEAKVSLPFHLAFSHHLCYHMEKHYISGMSDSNAATAVSVFYYIQENLNAFNSLLIAERSADAVLTGRLACAGLFVFYSEKEAVPMVNAGQGKTESDHILSREERIREIQSLNLLSDVFMSVALKDVPACQHILRILTGIDDLKVKEVRTQYTISPNQNPFCAARRAGGDREREVVSYRDSAER